MSLGVKIRPFPVTALLTTSVNSSRNISCVAISPSFFSYLKNNHNIEFSEYFYVVGLQDG